ncbi:MAG: asparaginase [Deferrisomatales bacterium]
MTAPQAPAPLVHVLRGGWVESIHRGHLVAARPEGEVVCTLGDPEFPTFLRSAAKPLQAVPVVETGAADRYGLTDAELALMCGSVSGQDFHVAAVRSVLAKVGWDESLLDCGVHRPSHRPTAKRLAEAGQPFLPVHNNCAGKHAAMLVLCAHHGWDPKGYIRGDHPVQRLILDTVAELCALPTAAVGVGVDGCGVPVFRVPLRNLARAYARHALPEADPELSASRRRALERLNRACAAHPEMVAGDDRVCTEAMRAGGGRFLAKTGAEGSYGIALFDRGLGVAFKIEDGSARAIDPVAVEVLAQAGAVDPGALTRFHRPQVRNHRREVVGELVPVFDLGGALGPA